jgi:uncharacterized membrane protein YedE/YeeE
MSKTREEKARDVVEKGALYFILFYGVIKFGGMLFLINLAIDLVFNRKYMEAFGYIETITEMAVVCAIGGAIFGIIIWSFASLKGKTKKNQMK